MAMTGGGGLPASFTINGGPWQGVYNDRRRNADGSYSYYGPVPTGTVKGSGAWAKQYTLPALHFTVGTDWSIHASLDMGGKNAHLHWNGGTPSWDLAALDGDKESWRQAVEATHVGAIDFALASAANQLDTGASPAFVPTPSPTPTSSATEDLDLSNKEMWPSLSPTAPQQTAPQQTAPQTTANTAPVFAEPVYAADEADDPGPPPGFEDVQPDAQPWPPTGVVEEGYSMYSTQPEDYLTGAAHGPPPDSRPSCNPRRASRTSRPGRTRSSPRPRIRRSRPTSTSRTRSPARSRSVMAAA